MQPYIRKFQENESTPQFQIVDHGVDHAQYFPGHGTSFTKWDEAFTGAGMTPKEAIDDALEQIASTSPEMQPADLDKFYADVEKEAQEMYGDKYDHDFVSDAQDKSGDYETEDDRDYSELYYYVSIDYMTSKEESGLRESSKGTAHETKKDVSYSEWSDTFWTMFDEEYPKFVVSSKVRAYAKTAYNKGKTLKQAISNVPDEAMERK